jgi:hypothetical protein
LRFIDGIGTLLGSGLAHRALPREGGRVDRSTLPRRDRHTAPRSVAAACRRRHENRAAGPPTPHAALATPTSDEPTSGPRRVGGHRVRVQTGGETDAQIEVDRNECRRWPARLVRRWCGRRPSRSQTEAWCPPPRSSLPGDCAVPSYGVTVGRAGPSVRRSSEYSIGRPSMEVIGRRVLPRLVRCVADRRNRCHA